MMGFVKRPWVWIPLLLLTLFGTVVLAAKLFVPDLVRSQGNDYVARNLPGKQLAMGAIAFDPWRLALTIDDIAIADAKHPDRPLVAMNRLAIDAGIASLWKLSPRLDSVTVTAPVVDAVLRGDGSLNLAELVPPDDGTPVPEVWIGTLTVRHGVIGFTDARRAVAQTHRLTPVNFALKDFATTSASGGGFKLDARSDAGETLAWAGTLAMAPAASTGNIRIGALQLATISRFAGDLLPVTMTAGAIDIAASYRFAIPPAAAGGAPPPTVFDADISTLALRDAAITASTGDAIGIKALRVAPTRLSFNDDSVGIGEVSIAGVTVARPGGERAAVTGVTLAPTRYALSTAIADIGAVAIDGISVSGRGRNPETVALAGLGIGPSQVRMTPREADIGAVTASGLRLAARVAADNKVTVAGLYPLAPAPKAAPKAAPATDWALRLAGFSLDDAAVRLLIDRGASAPASSVNFAPLTLKLGPLTPALDTPLTVDLASGIVFSGSSAKGRARLAVAGTASPKTATANLAIDMTGLPLPAVAALAPPLPVTVRGGALTVKGQLKIANGRAGPAPDFTGNLGIGDFDLVQREDGSDLLRWKQLDVVGIRYRSAPQQLAIARIDFDRAVSRITITRQAKLNLATVAGVETPSLGEAPDTTEPDKAATTTIKVAAPVSSSLSAAGKLFPIRIGAVNVRGSTIGFADFSIEPNFAANIEGFTGSITGLSTTPGSQAKFALKGYIIDRYSPVVISGFANPFAYDANTDLTAKFSNIELPVFNPYSGRFAGYAIARGKLSTTLHYRIVNRGLNADHNIVIDQLTWGEATDSKDKVSLPIRLATSLLKDKNGVIDLDLPVEGTLDDPKFKIWPVVWKVVGNVLTKLITAPFALIGSLFGGGPEAQFVSFDPGSALLAPEADKSLKAVAKGLAEKAEINLDIPAGPGIREDGEAMTTKAFETAVLAGKKGPLAADYASFDAEKKADRLKSLYKTKFGSGPKFPAEAGTTKAGMFAGGEAKSAANAARIKWLEDQLRPKFAPSEAELASLGQARAAVVRDALLGENAIEPTRVFIATDKAVTAKDGKAVMELTVK